jgi:hypothetical protein
LVLAAWIKAFLVAVSMAVVPFLFGWGLAGAVTLGCDWDSKGCGVPDGGGLYFAAVLGSPLLLALSLKLPSASALDRWSRALGFSAGALAAAVVTLAMGTSVGHWIVFFVLLAATALMPWVEWDAARRDRERRRRRKEPRRSRGDRKR